MFAADIRKVVERAWLATAFFALLALFAFPVYKHAPIAFAPVALGVAAAVTIRKAPAGWLRGLSRRLYGTSAAQWLVSLGALALLLRIPLIVHPIQPVSDHEHYRTAAVGLAHGIGYGQSLLYPPGQSGWLAAWIWAFGDALRLLATVQVLLAVAAIPLFFFAVRRHSEQAARWGTLLMAAYPSLVLWSGTLGHETTVLFLQSALLALYELAERKRAWWIWCALGCVAGATALVRPTYLIFPALIALALWTADRGRLGRALAAAALAGVFLSLTISPWTLRNWRMFGEFCPVSANFGRVLLSSNHPKSDGLYMETREVGADLNTVAKDRVQKQVAIEAIRQDPVRFAGLCAKRVAYLWGADSSILDFVLGTQSGDTPSKAKLVLTAALQFFWSWFICAWCIGALRFVRESSAGNGLTTLCISWCLALWTLHAVAEPLSRHHLPLIALIGFLALPGYWAWVSGERKAAPAAPRTAQAAGA